MSKDKNISKAKRFNKEMLSLKKDNVLLEKKLDSLLKLTESINRNYTAEAIIKVLHDSLKFILNIKNASFVVKTRDWEILLNYGKDFNIDNYDIEEELSHYKEARIIDLKDSHISSYEYIIPTFHKQDLLGVLLISGVKNDLIQGSKANFCYLSTLVNLTLIALENKRLFRTLKGTKKINKDIETARQIQKQLVPSVFPSSKNYDFQGNYIPFETDGGDYYDVIKIDEENIAFCIADVSGKGISAGMLMSNFQASLRTLLSKNIDLKELITSLNKMYLAATKQLRFVTMFIGKYNVKTRELEYINAGHNYPILKNGDKIIQLETGCTIIGMFENLPFVESGIITLEKNAILVMYTDGFSEMKNERDEEFGIENIINTLIANVEEPFFSINSNFMKALYKFKGTASTFDDISLLCAKFY